MSVDDLGLSATGPVRETVPGALLAFLAVTLLVGGTLLGVLVSSLRALEAVDRDLER